MDPSSPSGPLPAGGDRRAALAVLARAATDDLAAVRDSLSPTPEHTVVRGPDTGLVMVEGRVGGGGAPFNVGEVTCTRCVVTLATGEAGFGHVLGRETGKALLVAVLDAAGQCPATRAQVADAVARLAAGQAADAARRAAEVAATRVEFFTMAREQE